MQCHPPYMQFGGPALLGNVACTRPCRRRQRDLRLSRVDYYSLTFLLGPNSQLA
jgi:hypothetical protein